jgi:hypothetical protein
MQDTDVTMVVYGTREAVIAEYGVDECYAGPYLVVLVSTHAYVPVEVDTLQEAREQATFMATHYACDTMAV